eukprot:CAMPEP_0115828148 /NCGR_PEP_ID=MMETSP0287-20121206/422_1 /TAXON_ID=412157 /ORGANISM="Chrysochromulina rotalis, Strain UIO044" /LENGTH=109 /DNA_ID=CAMNT_0003281351 /DNA_START=242 /DNA_END=571 /DNA_ORIENTATION=-
MSRSDTSQCPTDAWQYHATADDTARRGGLRRIAIRMTSVAVCAYRPPPSATPLHDSFPHERISPGLPPFSRHAKRRALPTSSAGTRVVRARSGACGAPQVVAVRGPSAH